MTLTDTIMWHTVITIRGQWILGGVYWVGLNLHTISYTVYGMLILHSVWRNIMYIQPISDLSYFFFKALISINISSYRANV